MGVRSTREVGELLGIRTGTLSRAIWERRLREPARGPGGCFLWTPEDVERASLLLCHKAAADVIAEREREGAPRA